MAKYPTNPELIKDLTAFRIQRGLTNATLGKMLNESATFISKYLNDKLDHNPEDFDARAKDMLGSISARLDLPTALFSNDLSTEFAGMVNLARTTQDVAFVYGPAGSGKTCASLLYRLQNPSTIYHKITGRSTSASDLEAGVFAQIKKKEGYKANQRRWPFMVSSMKGDGGAIIIDNAHRLDRSGRDWGFDFNEESGKAIIYVGNPEMQAKIETNDQQQSRIGAQWEFNWTLNPEKKIYHPQLSDMAHKVAAQFSDEDFADEIADLTAFVSTREGVLRSVRKQVILATQLAKVKNLSPRAAFRDAHRNLSRNYMLPTD